MTYFIEIFVLGKLVSDCEYKSEKLKKEKKAK